MSDRTDGVIAFVAGLAAGAALGLLFAPQSGKNTRGQFRRKGHQAADELDEMMDKGREEWREAKRNTSDAADRTREDVDDFVRYLFEEGKDLWERMKKEDGSTARQSGEDQAHRTGH